MKTIEFPSGDWTHEELAALNKMTKPQVYLQLREAITKGEIFLAGKRYGGRGKPTNVYSLAKSDVQIKHPRILASTEPTIAQAIQVLETKSIIDMTPWTLKEVCPVCKVPLMAHKDAEGVMVWCDQPSEICPCPENPRGHGSTEKNALEILMAKWGNFHIP